MVAIDVDRGSFIVHPKAEPRRMPSKGEFRVEHHVEDPVVDGGATLLSAEEAIEAATDERTAFMLYTCAMGSVEQALHMAINFRVEPLEALAKLARETRDQLAVNRYISQGEAP
jgi:hypothetical protein